MREALSVFIAWLKLIKCFLRTHKETYHKQMYYSYHVYMI